MKTKKVDERVKKILEEAKKEAKREGWSKEVTIRHILWQLLNDEKSILRRYLIKNGYMSYSGIEGLYDDNEEVRNEEQYEEFIYELEETFMWVNAFNRNEGENYRNKLQIGCSRDVADLLEYANELRKEANKKKIDEIAFTVVLIQYENPIWNYIEDNYDECVGKLTNYFSEERYISGELEKDIKLLWESSTETGASKKKENSNKLINNEKIDPTVSNMLFCLNDKFKQNDDIIIRKRDDEIEEVFTILQKMKTRNVILVGDPGVGKTAIAEGIAERIVKGISPKEFKDKKVMSLDINSLMEDTKFLGQFEGKVKKLFKTLEENEGVILFIDEIHNIIGAGRTTDSSYDFSNALKPILTTGKVQVIGATTQEEYDKWFAGEGALKRRFKTIEVKEPKQKDLYEMLEGQINKLSQYHGVKVSKEVFSTVVSFAAGMNNNVKEPARTIEALDTALVMAKRDEKAELDIYSILKSYKRNIKMFKEIKEKTPELLKATAYHEVGHCIANKVLLKEKNRDVIYLSIIPTEEYLGVNVYESEDAIGYRQNKSDLVDRIVTSLAGYVAAKFIVSDDDAGKRWDLEHATWIANNMVLSFGMQMGGSSLGSYSNFSNNDKLDFNCLSNEQKNDLVKQRDEILKEAEQKAKSILESKKEEMEILVEALMERGALNKEEVDKLYNKDVTLKDLPPAYIELIK